MSLYDMLFKSREQRGKEHRASIDSEDAAKKRKMMNKGKPTAGAPRVKAKPKKAKRAIGDVIRGGGRSAYIDKYVDRASSGR